MQTVTDALTGCAFTVGHPDIPDLYAFVSGDYVTFGWAVYGNQGVIGFNLDETGPWPHGLGENGIYGVDAAQLYDTVSQMLVDFINLTGRWADDNEEEEE